MIRKQTELDIQTLQQQIQHKGAFCPLQWLLDCGLLHYHDYERWRYGALATLAEAVTCKGDALLKLLQKGQEHARALKLVSEAQVYHDWRPDQAARTLTLSRQRELAHLLGQRWLRPQDAPQLDLFMDSGAASAENELADHLAARQWNRAEAAYAQLCEVAPNHAQLGGYETLLLYGKHIAASPAIDNAALDDELAGLEQDIAPLARDLLCAQARDYLAPAWQRLAQSLPVDIFNPTQPARHASYAWARIPDWPQVVASIEATPDYAEHAELLHGLAQALYALGRQESALLLWARLCEQAPEQAEQQLDARAFAPLHAHWQQFSDSEEPLPLSLFPAWLLLREPGLLHHLDEGAYPAPCGEGFRASAALLRSRVEGVDEMLARQALQALSPALLRVYLHR